MSRWLRFLARRLSAAVAVSAVLVMVSFLIVRLIPGDPARRVAGPDASAAYVDQVRSQLGLGGSILSQFVDFVSGILNGDLGSSISSGQSVTELIVQRLPFTFALTFAALALATLLGVTLGLGAAIVTRESRHPSFERVFVAISGGAGVIPEVAYGTLLVALFAVAIPVFPVSGVAGSAAFVLPTLAIGIRPAFNLARIVRVEAIQVLSQPYMVTAKSKRLSALRRNVVHALPNIATATLTLMGLLFSYLIGGVVVIESLFAWPGLGSALVTAVINRDYPVIQGLVLLLALLVVLMNLIIDLILGVLDKKSLVTQ